MIKDIAQPAMSLFFCPPIIPRIRKMGRALTRGNPQGSGFRVQGSGFGIPWGSDVVAPEPCGFGGTPPWNFSQNLYPSEPRLTRPCGACFPICQMHENPARGFSYICPMGLTYGNAACSKASPAPKGHTVTNPGLESFVSLSLRGLPFARPGRLPGLAP